MLIQSKHSLPAHGQIYRPDQPPHATKTPLSRTIYFSITGLFSLTFSAAATAIFFSLSSRNFLK